MSFRYLTAGESHGRGLVGILEGLPSGMPLLEEDIYAQLRRRKQGYGRGARQKIETDEVQILSGVRFGETLGSPISLLIWNKDWQAWQGIMKAEPSLSDEPIRRQVFVPRPGHADLVGGIKYDHRDLRNVLERASARETTMRVALGSIARRFLGELGIHLASRVVQIGSGKDGSNISCCVSDLNARADLSPVRCLDPNAEKEMIREIDQAKEAGETLGGIFEVCASGVPVGLGSYAQWDRRLEGKIAQALMSLNAIVGVELGLGFEGAQLPGSRVHDEILPGRERKGPEMQGQSGERSERGFPQLRETLRFGSNSSGGVIGGMSTGQNLVVRAAMKPLATLMNPLKSVDLNSGEATLAHIERSDVCAVPAAAVISESLIGLVLAEAILEKFGGDSMREIVTRWAQWKRQTPLE